MAISGTALQQAWCHNQGSPAIPGNRGMFRRMCEDCLDRFTMSGEPVQSRHGEGSLLYRLEGAARGAKQGAALGVEMTTRSYGIPNGISGLMGWLSFGPAAAFCASLAPTMGFALTRALKGLADPRSVGLKAAAMPPCEHTPASAPTGFGARVRGAVKGLAEGMELGLMMNIAGRGLPSLAGGLLCSCLGPAGMLLGAAACPLVGGAVTAVKGFIHPRMMG